MTLTDDEFDNFESFLKKIKPRDFMRIIYARMGDSPVTYRTAGNDRWSSVGAVMQVGVVEWTGAGATSGTVTQSYAYPFRHAPLVVATPWLNPAQDIRVVTYPNAGNCRFDWFSTAAVTSVNFCWIAIGPMSG
jgi:hypothetical protein